MKRSWIPSKGWHLPELHHPPWSGWSTMRDITQSKKDKKTWVWTYPEPKGIRQYAVIWTQMRQCLISCSALPPSWWRRQGTTPVSPAGIAEVSQLLTILRSLISPCSVSLWKTQNHRIFGLERTSGDGVVQPCAQTRGSYTSSELCPVGFWVSPRIETQAGVFFHA